MSESRLPGQKLRGARPRGYQGDRGPQDNQNPDFELQKFLQWHLVWSIDRKESLTDTGGYCGLQEGRGGNRTNGAVGVGIWKKCICMLANTNPIAIVPNSLQCQYDDDAA